MQETLSLADFLPNLHRKKLVTKLFVAQSGLPLKSSNSMDLISRKINFQNVIDKIGKWLLLNFEFLLISILKDKFKNQFWFTDVKILCIYI